jgi:hypothetical protein
MDDILEIGNEIIEDITKDAIQMFKQAIERNSLVLTTELLDSFQYNIVRSAELIYSEIEFRMYGRFKDMKQIRYAAHMPPIEAMEFFVEKIGVDKFAWVPGYDSKSSVPTDIAARRIAWAIAKHHRSVPSVKRGYRGTWYNENVMKMINEAKKQLRWRTSEWLASKVVKTIETET